MSAFRLLGMLCIRNEADRYLEQCLEWQLGFLDDVFVYDDRSDDASVEVARSVGVPTVVRERDEPSFLEHEGLFRQQGWEHFERNLQPTKDDWVLAFDADEFLVAPSSADTRHLLTIVANELKVERALGCRVKIHEVFDVMDDGTPLIRTDGYWPDITGIRFYRYRPGGRFPNRKMACGSAPSYVDPVADAYMVEMLHFGYARKDDRIDKHNRYFGLPGHSAQHIESIISPPTLTPWRGRSPL